MIAAENISFLTRTVVMFYLSLLVYGAITMIKRMERDRLSLPKKILYTFTFLIFMFTYIPISAVALVKRVEMEADLPWKHLWRADHFQEKLIDHGYDKSDAWKHIFSYAFCIAFIYYIAIRRKSII